LEGPESLFCLSDGLVAYWLDTVRKPSPSALQGDIIYFILSSCAFEKMVIHHICVSQHDAVARRFRITFSLSDGLASYYTLLESSFQGIANGI